MHLPLPNDAVVTLSPLEWSGRYESMQRASKRLRIVVPIMLLTIFGLLYSSFRSTAESLIVMVIYPNQAWNADILLVDDESRAHLGQFGQLREFSK